MDPWVWGRGMLSSKGHTNLQLRGGEQERGRMSRKIVKEVTFQS